MNGLVKKDWFGLMSDMFDGFSSGIENLSYGYPRINTVENENDFRVDVYYPGMKKEDFKVNVENRILSISSTASENNEENSEKYHFREFSKREFTRRFTLPEEVVKNKIKASYEDGVLKIIIPKDKAKEKQSKFDVNIE